ncbi:oxygenase MpaB family protein [Paractinoplanes atraurantiacus]|uniref:ER-bound oxygenase mpaB/mpaB'/Rubber oxygenase catalytic domain-containing protein n=1 Tax=Paractinoplanes atraurantiacus TaxID=1036182 RepID=A0A285JL06_9ACTN|nr:oxygenase MpaB family protein [Actinoplanes atraurantiacus]SNY60989.1 hypothetical protein SAMN05421748_12254 [Actinoplanes atraurantiacus]
MTTPARFAQDRAWSERAAAPLRRLCGRGAQPSADELEALRHALSQQDELAAALVRAVPARELHRAIAAGPAAVGLSVVRPAGVGLSVVRPAGVGLSAVGPFAAGASVAAASAVASPGAGVFEVSASAVANSDAAGPAAAASAPVAVRAFFEAVLERPAWVDDRLLERGAQACRAFGMDAGLVLAYGSLLGGYRTAAALEPLVRTGRMAGGETLRRIKETSIWWRAVTAPGGLEPGRDGFRLTLHVRVMHALVNARLAEDPTWDTALRGTPINQYDQASTLGVFSTSFLLHLRLLGVRVSRRDAHAVMHVWSYIGWLMGVDEQWLPHTEKRGRRLLYHFLSYDPPPDDNSRALAQALIAMTDQEFPGRRRRRFERERALSISSWLLGRRAMHDLGLPYRPPWYGLGRVAANMVMTHALGRLPGGRRLLLARGERHARARFARWGIPDDAGKAR